MTNYAEQFNKSLAPGQSRVMIVLQFDRKDLTSPDTDGAYGSFKCNKTTLQGFGPGKHWRQMRT